MRVLRLASALIGLALLPACAVNPPAAAAVDDRIMPEEIAASGATNAYELVELVRPDWLRQRVDPTATGSLLQTLVLFNGARYGMLPSLRDLPVESIGGVDFWLANAAQRADLKVGAVIAVYAPGVPMVRPGQRDNAFRNPVRTVDLAVYPPALATQGRVME